MARKRKSAEDPPIAMREARSMMYSLAWQFIGVCVGRKPPELFMMLLEGRAS